MSDVVIDRSSAQKRDRIEKMRQELQKMGLSIVSTEWLAKALMDIAKLELKSRRGK